ncbi:MAG: hypothetical protein ACRDQZ_09265 [Mycobacteriales bacterium]
MKFAKLVTPRIVFEMMLLAYALFATFQASNINHLKFQVLSNHLAMCSPQAEITTQCDDVLVTTHCEARQAIKWDKRLTCSLDGKTWWTARADGMCYSEDRR